MQVVKLSYNCEWAIFTLPTGRQAFTIHHSQFPIHQQHRHFIDGLGIHYFFTNLRDAEFIQ